jgi:chemotaxis protein histidine kinase CheA
VSLTAGRGMGLNIIKKKLEKIGGEISILTEPTKYTRFEILIPIEQDN